MKSWSTWVLVAALASVAAVPFLAAPATAPAQQQPSVDQLIERLNSDDFHAREAATRALLEREDALPALRKALRSRHTEVRRRAGEILKSLQAKSSPKRKQRLLARIKDGQVDEFIDQMLAQPDQVDEQTWQALLDLTKRILARANKQGGKRIPFPVVGRRRDEAVLPEVIDNGDIRNRRALANRLTSDCGAVGSVLVSQGPCRFEQRVVQSIVFVNGDLDVISPAGAGLIGNCVVFCDGSIETGDVGKSVLIATGPIKITVKHPDAVVIPNARNALGLLKLFDTRQAGVEVEEARAGVVVKAVLDGKPFAKAGVRAGDRVLAIGGKKLANMEQFRRAVRRGAMANEDVALTLERSGRKLEITVPLTD
jgi:hypothetical protein